MKKDYLQILQLLLDQQLKLIGWIVGINEPFNRTITPNTAKLIQEFIKGTAEALTPALIQAL